MQKPETHSYSLLPLFQITTKSVVGWQNLYGRTCKSTQALMVIECLAMSSP